MIHMLEEDEYCWLLALSTENPVSVCTYRRTKPAPWTLQQRSQITTNKPTRHNTVCVIREFLNMLGIGCELRRLFDAWKRRFQCSQKKNPKTKRHALCFAHLLERGGFFFFFQTCTCIRNCLLNCQRNLQREIEERWQRTIRGRGRIATQGKSNHSVSGPSTDSPLQIAISAE